MTVDTYEIEAQRKKEAAYENEVLLEGLSSDDPVMRKEANDTLDSFVRYKMREGGLVRKILPMQKVTKDDLDRTARNEDPVMIVDFEAESPAAYTLGFGDAPDTYELAANRFEVPFSRISTNLFWKDTAQLMTWNMDVRTVVSDNSIKDMLVAEDSRFFRAVNNILRGPDVTLLTSGVSQWRTLSGQISRDSFWDGVPILASTPSSLSPTKMVINNLTAYQFAKWGYIEMGGEKSGEYMRNGFAEEQLGGIQLITTIKRDLVPTNDAYYFADPKFMGRFYGLEDITMYTEAKYYIIKFFSYELVGLAIANPNSVARATFV